MKKYIYLVLVVFSSFISSSQAPDYDDLKILYADGKYEKLVTAADKYTMKEDLKKDPFPFMWLAKGLYKVSLSGTSDEKYKGAYKEAIAALGKSMKIDKDSACILVHKEFVDEFQMSIVERVNNDISANKIKDAAGWASKYYKITTHPLGPKYIEAAAKYKSADKGGAAMIWKECDVLMNKIVDVTAWSKADLNLLKIGVIQTAECFVNARQKEKAVSLLNKVAPWFEGDEEFKEKYDEMVN
jgi:hypothetical protein